MTGDGEEDAHLRGRGFWAPADGAPSRGILGDVPATIILMAALFAAIQVFMELAPAAVADEWADRFGLSPLRLALGPDGPGGVVGLVGPLVSHIFIHATFTHLFFNLLWFFVFGTPIARRLRSAWRFCAFFVACGAAGGGFFSLFHLADPTLLIGASGGVSGLLGGLVRFAFHRPLSRPSTLKGVLPLTDRSVLIWSAVVVAMNASIEIFGAGVGAAEGDIAWQAHVGGYLFGLAAFPLFDPKRRRPSN